MEAVQALLENFWILKEKDKDLYYKLKREAGKYRRFFSEQLGWGFVNNERVLKLEKIPSHAESFMGISAFQDKRDYCILCALLIFLEDKEDGEQFLLSELVSLVEAQLQEYLEVDWTMFTQRKSLVRVLKYAEEMKFLEIYDGTVDGVSSSIEHEVLYENTGLSRYFATNFGYRIAGFTSYRDFELEPGKGLETDRGHFRTNRVYRQLVAAPAMYWDSSDDPEAVYLKNQRQWVQKYLGEHLGGRLDIHKNAAFFIMEEDRAFGDLHPREASVSEITMNICAIIREQVLNQTFEKGKDDCVWISLAEFTSFMETCKETYQAAWSKEFREMPLKKLVDSILDYMESWMLADREGDEILLYPACGKITGVYPQEFLRKEAEKHE